MYADPKLVKDELIRFKIDDYLQEQIEAIRTIHGGQKATIDRRLWLVGLKAAIEDHTVLKQADEELFNEEKRA